jgi:hypothetical protein
MSLVVDTFNSLLPYRAKKTPSGWISFNAPCCHHRGHSTDDRQRGGVIYKDGLVYHCFNCGYATGWTPGSPISEKLKSLVIWLGGSDDVVKKLIFEALKTEAPEYKSTEVSSKVDFEIKPLPDGALPLNDWANQSDSIPPELQTKFIDVVSYVLDRGYDPYDRNFYWSPEAGYDNRVIIPFFFRGRLVGNTARRITDGKPKYLSDQHPHFVFNVDAQKQEQKYVFVTEGPFDALSVGGMALLTNDVADQQFQIINSLRQEVIVIPDQDMAGLNLIKKAIKYNWSVAFPNWDHDVKDCADAVRKYGKLFVTVDAIKTAQQGEIKIKMAMKQLEQRLKRTTND